MESCDEKHGRRASDGCVLHGPMTECLTMIKADIKLIEAFWHNAEQRIAKMEPIVASNEKEITYMRRLLIGTLITSFTAAVSVVATLGIIVIRHYQ